jgi:flagellar assembly protein FliH
MSSLPAALFEPVRAFEPDGRFGAFAANDIQHEPDAREQSYADGYSHGMTDALARARLEQDAQDTARQQIELAFAQLFDADRPRIEARLRETVLVLCDHLLAPLVTDAHALSVRITSALDLLRRTEDERVLRLNPEDVALVEGRLPRDLRVEADPSVERGGLRIEHPDGGVEDGPAQWHRMLAEALALDPAGL